jgi:hypothetical protein
VAGCGGQRDIPDRELGSPTYTLNALSLRGAEQLAENWGSIAS